MKLNASSLIRNLIVLFCSFFILISFQIEKYPCHALLATITTYSFACTHSIQNISVPVGSNYMYVDIRGASGGYGNNGAPGYGARVRSYFSVEDSAQLHVVIGCIGSSFKRLNSTIVPGGYNGGGNGFNLGGTGGGGASDIRLAGRKLNDRIIIAGGGGGFYLNGYCGYQKGGDAGQYGMSGTSDVGCTAGGKTGGGGGSWTSGGSAGNSYWAPAAQAGSLGYGGAGGSSISGGGGGGYYGGGGGFEGGSGGGGSSRSFGFNTTYTTGFQIGNGTALISFFFSPSSAFLTQEIWFPLTLKSIDGKYTRDYAKGYYQKRGTLFNGSAIDSISYPGGTSALHLNGSLQQYVSVAPFTTKDSGLSIYFWYRPSNNQDLPAIFDFGNGASSDNIGYYLNSPTFLVVNNNTDFSFVNGPECAINSWCFIVITMTPNLRSSTWKIYLNGTLISTTGNRLYPRSVERFSNHIGRSNSPGDPFYNGWIADFRLYQTVLQNWEIEGMYNSFWKNPTSSPSRQPTNLPSSQPSGLPTSQPSIRISSILRNGLVAYYPFRRNANDKSGNGNNGLTRSGVASSVDRFGIAGSALSFDGTSGYIEVPGHQFNFRSDLSLSFWMNPSSFQDAYTYIFDKTSFSNALGQHIAGFFVRMSGTQANHYAMCITDSVTDSSCSSLFTVSADVWTHVAITKSGTFVKIYLNGLLSLISTVTADIIANGNLPLIIGGYNGGYSSPASSVWNHYNGALDDIFIFNRSISNLEVLELYQWDSPTSQPSRQPSSQPSVQPSRQPSSRPTRLPSSQPSAHPSSIPIMNIAHELKRDLVAYYPFHGNVKDRSGNQLDGNITGTISYAPDRFGAAGNALSFDGSNSYVIIPGDQFNFKTKMSFSIWLKVAVQNPDWNRIFEKCAFNGSIFQAGWSFQFNPSPFTTTFFYQSNPRGLSYTSPIPITQNQWTHIAVTKDNAIITWYINGNYVGYNDGGRIEIASNGKLPLLLGGACLTYRYPKIDAWGTFTGDMDELFIFNRSLSASEVKQLYSFDAPSSSPTRQPTSLPSGQPTALPTGEPSARVFPGSLRTSLTAIYQFNGDTKDKTENNNDGVVYGGAEYVADRFDIPRSAFHLNGLSNYIRVPGQQFNFYNAFSLSFWVKPAIKQTSNARLFSKQKWVGKKMSAGWALGQNTTEDNQLRPFITLTINGSNAVPSGITAAVNPNAWNHFVFVKVGTVMRLFVNGLIEASGLCNSAQIPSSGNSPLIIGGSYSYAGSPIGSFFNGSIDDLWIFNRSLTGSEVLWLYSLDAPTSIPTGQPSTQPSSRPSLRPIFHPTARPSTQPSNLPSSQPISHPTDRPTAQPTSLPLSQPTSSPSSGPSSQPSSQPIAHPSSLPSILPTRQPTSQPSSVPSLRPTTGPSGLPTVVPTQQPIPLPSASPSIAPSSQPSSGPTTKPTSQPSSDPSTQPSALPSLAPSRNPFAWPTSCPSALPSDLPTSFPSSEPSESPSGFPSSFPSTNPTSQPSIFPSMIPTSQPSARPISFPTSFPSIKPSNKPSCQPANRPTGQPIPQPSALPITTSTERPSLRPFVLPSPPSGQPTSQPVEAPSSQPTTKPVTLPSAQPTNHPSRTPISQPSSVPTVLKVSPTITPSKSTTNRPTLFPSTTRSPTTTKAPLVSPAPTFRYLRIHPQSVSRSLAGKLFLLGAFPSSPSSALDDVELSAPFVGESFIIFGKNSKYSNLDVSQMISNQSFAVRASSSGGGMIRDSTSRSLTVVGDVDGDGITDLLVGDPMTGKAYLFFQDPANRQSIITSSTSSTSSFFSGNDSSSSTDFLGWAAASLGDLDRDGYGDFAVSAILTNTVYLIFGRSYFPPRLVLSQLSNKDGRVIKIVGRSGQSNFGMALSSAGDFNNDGRTDILISGLSISSQSFLTIVFGPSGWTKDVILDSPGNYSILTIAAPKLSFAGLSLSGLGDINGDGFDDIIIGSLPYQGGYSQRSYVLYGRVFPSSARQQDLELTAMNEGEDGFVVFGAGFQVASIGDVNRDGFMDFMITSYSSWQGQGNAYLMIPPRNVTSFPTISPTWRPSTVPSGQPTSMPSTSIPSSSPTRSLFESNQPTNQDWKSLNRTYVPTIKSTRRPTVGRTSTPSRTPTTRPSQPPTKAPTASPTRSSQVPTIIPSVMRQTVIPTMKPSARPSSTRRPFTNKPTPAASSHFPSSTPTFSPLDEESFNITLVKDSGRYIGDAGRTRFIINPSSSSNLMRKGGGQIEITGGGGGSKVYSIYPFNPPAPSRVYNRSISLLIITIKDFRLCCDMLDLTEFSSSLHEKKDLSYSTNPLLIYLSPIEMVRLPSLNTFVLTERNLLFSSGSSTSSSSSSTLTVSGTTVQNDATIQLVVIVLVVLIGLSIFFGCSQSVEAATSDEKQEDYYLQRAENSVVSLGNEEVAVITHSNIPPNDELPGFVDIEDPPISNLPRPLPPDTTRKNKIVSPVSASSNSSSRQQSHNSDASDSSSSSSSTSSSDVYDESSSNDSFESFASNHTEFEFLS